MATVIRVPSATLSERPQVAGLRSRLEAVGFAASASLARCSLTVTTAPASQKKIHASVIELKATVDAPLMAMPTAASQIVMPARRWGSDVAYLNSRTAEFPIVASVIRKN